MQPEPTAEDPNLEQRRHKRVDLFQEIVCASGEVEARTRLGDLSVGGMFVDLPRPPFPRGTPVTVRFALHGGEPWMVLDAEVHYVQDGIGMGVRFVDIRDEDRSRVAVFVEEASRRKGAGGPPLRKSARVFVRVPIRVRGVHPDGPAFDERTSIVTLSKHGACLVSRTSLDVGMKLLLETVRGLEFRSNVVWVGTGAGHGMGQVGVQCRGLAQALGFQFP
jgi:hypothetical protein